MDYDAKVIVKTEIDNSDFDDGLKEIKKEANSDDINIKLEDTHGIMKKVLQVSKKIGKSFLGISASTLKLAGTIIKMTASLGALGVIVGIIAMVAVGIANAFKQVTSQNEELKNKLDETKAKLQYIKFILGTGFTKVIEFLVKAFSWIVDKIYETVIALGGIIKAITGVNIFAKATVNNFKEANKSANSLKKTLAGFDEMNILGEGTSGVGLLSDLSKYFDMLKDANKEVDSMGEKIKKWFLGEGNNSIVEAITNNFRKLPKTLVELFAPTYKKIVEPYLVQPFIQGVNEIMLLSEPLWRPLYNSFLQTLEDIKTKSQPFIDWFDKNIISKLSELWNGYQKDFNKTFAPFINTIIDWINRTFGIFGVHLEKIETESETTGNAIEEKIGGSFDTILEKGKPLLSWADNFMEKLKKLTGKEWKVSTNVEVKGNSIKDWYNDVFREQLKTRTGISLPKLAKGGIINMPGKGVALGGEVAPEGVIPLTDSQQMALLGEAIGRYVTINATIPVYAYNREVDRQIKRIQAEDNFASNR